MENKFWFVLRTNPRAEKVVSERLSALDIDNYLPIKRVLKQRNDRKKWVDEVLIKGYVFVYLTEQKRGKVFEVFGVVRYLFFVGKIAKVTEREIEVLKIFCELKGVKIEKNGFQTGAMVEIIAGPLIGMTGILKSAASGNKVSIYIEQLGLFASVNVLVGDVRKI